MLAFVGKKLEHPIAGLLEIAKPTTYPIPERESSRKKSNYEKMIFGSSCTISKSISAGDHPRRITIFDQ
jgi:hypothetical protein